MRRLDLKGLRFSRLLILDFSHRKGNHLYWKCLCDCGNITFQSTTNLRQGKVVYCGCFAIELATQRLPIPKVKFEKGVASFNVLYAQYVGGAKRRDIKFLLTKEQFKTLTSENCHYCGTAPFTHISRRGTNGDYIYNGIDRKDSSENYTMENCVPSCKDCNLLKMDMSYGAFLNQIRKIHRNIYE